VGDADLFLKLLLQLAVILIACRAIGSVGRRLGQTQGVSEMVAGILLGPSLFGLLWPGAHEGLFPRTIVVQGVAARHPSMTILYCLSQLGLVLYMFTVGLRFDTTLLKGRAGSAGLVSGAGILVPMALGCGAAVLLRGEADLFAPAVSNLSAMLYLGASMSITAFPMLARILDEKGLARSRVGTLTLAAGASDDAMAWCLLALVLSSIKGHWLGAAVAVGGGAVYTLLMLWGGRKALAPFGRKVERDGTLDGPTLAAALMVCFLCAGLTDVVGIHAVFGAFIAGVAMPRGRFADQFLAHSERLTTGLLLPVFFVFSGLNTRIGLLTSGTLVLMTLVLTAIAIAGKGVACAVAARLSGEPWRDALTIGCLMNARGLMELIILNIGLEQGVITPTLFTMMVFMAVATTLMASPMVDWLSGKRDGAGART
jgi:Kef-type K+ transport system membrane component KefB